MRTWKTNDTRLGKMLEQSSQEKEKSNKRKEALDDLNKNCPYLFRMIESEPTMGGCVFHKGKEAYPFYDITAEGPVGTYKVALMDMPNKLSDLMQHLTTLFR